MSLLKRWDVRIGLAISLVGLLTALGYNVEASLPPTRTEMVKTIDEAIVEVDSKIVELRGVIEEAKSMTSTLALAVELNTDDRKWQRYKFLRYKQDTEGLTDEEQRELCSLASDLDLSAPGCA